MSIVSEKSKAFAVKIVRLARALSSEHREFVPSKQVLCSGTSIGANVRESEHAQGLKDFISKLKIALKEAHETLYWLELLVESEILSRREFEPLHEDSSELVRILAASVKTNKRKLTSAVAA